MLKIKDQNGKTKFVLLDDAEQPVTIDEFLLAESVKKEEDKEIKEQEDAATSKP